MNDYKTSISWSLLKKKLIRRSEDKDTGRGFKTEVASALGVVPQAVQRYFDPEDTTIPGMDKADKMAESLGEPLWQILKPDDAQLAAISHPTAAEIARRLPALSDRRLKAILALLKAFEDDAASDNNP